MRNMEMVGTERTVVAFFFSSNALFKLSADVIDTTEAIKRYRTLPHNLSKDTVNCLFAFA